MTLPTMEQGFAIRVRGQVQGVGFRPFVWRLARAAGLRGEVLNDAEGVLIRLVAQDCGDFIAALRADRPPLARIDAIEAVPQVFAAMPEGFSIAASAGTGAETRVTPDAATCPECRAEILAPGRRQGYAFTNCTHCGPRYTILRELPYDRARTTMAGFDLCPDCAAEYADPADRRFHAQPIACPACGPNLWYEAGGKEVAGDPVALAVAALKAGQVVAVKGLGGFHLACDAADARAVALLRARKRRPSKPFALMGTAAMIRAHATPSEACWRLLRDPAAPVVLVPARGTLPEDVAPGMRALGVMLPYTPLHHLLIAAFGGMLVMTSGNLSGAPQVTGNDEARKALARFADGFLMHNREIARRLDDGVERADPPMVIRRARGRVPGTLPLPPGFDGAPRVLAFGGQMKAAICLTKNGQAMVSQHLGDLDDAETALEYDRTLCDLAALFDHAPELAACDPHPGYRATITAEGAGLPLIRVWHHHAHLASCLGDNLWPLDGGRVAGIVMDGLGLGPDGTIWGGELLLGDYTGFERLAHLAPAPLPGGDRASREPWRNGLARLDQAGLSAVADRLFPDAPRALLRQAAGAGVNAPRSSSAGRLFDAFAALAGFAGAQSYEGEAAMRLEAMARPAAPYPFECRDGIIDPAPMLRAAAADLAAGRDRGDMAGAFHAGLARAFCAPARALVQGDRARAVALSGGVLQNAFLLRECLAALDGLPVLLHRQIPANDGGLAFGQALVAAAQHMAAAKSL